MNKKAISGVVVAILILLIAVIAVSIFWFALRPAIEKSTTGIGKGQECLVLDLSIESVSATQVKVARGADDIGVIKDVKVLVAGIEVTKTPTTVPDALETVTYTISALSGDVVEIAGVLIDDTICSVVDSTTVA